MKKLQLKINDIQHTLFFLNKISNLSILEVCLENGIYIPHFCYNKYLLIAGNCRICIIEIEKLIKPVISCLTLCINNISIYTNTFSLKKYRENLLEFLLINHPLDCPICDQAGECDLQEQIIKYGFDKSRFFFKKKSNLDIYLNHFVGVILNRCILCLRCVRLLREVNINNEDVILLGTIGRGLLSKINLYTKSSKLTTFNSGNIMDICPVGALTLKIKQFTYRPWELISSIHFDIFDSFGLLLQLDYKHTILVRVLPYLDYIFGFEIISDLTRLDLSMYKIDYNNLIVHNVKLIDKHNNLKNIFLYLSNNCLISFKYLYNIFKNLKNLNKFFFSTIRIYSNIINFYLLKKEDLFSLENKFLVILNRNLKLYMYRFFIFLNEIKKKINNIIFVNTNDLNIFNCFNIYKHKNSIIFSNNQINNCNNSLNKYLIKFLSFFKILLTFDDMFIYNIKNLNLNFLKNYIYIDFKKFKLKMMSMDYTTQFYSIANHMYDTNLIFNLLGINVTFKKQNIIFSDIIYINYLNVLKYNLKKKC